MNWRAQEPSRLFCQAELLRPDLELVLVPVLVDIVLSYEPCLVEVGIETVETAVLGNPRMKVAPTLKAVFLFGGRRLQRGFCIGATGMKEKDGLFRKWRSASLAFNPSPSPVTMYSDADYYATLSPSEVRVVKIDDPAKKWTIEQGPGAPEVRLARVVNTNRFFVAQVSDAHVRCRVVHVDEAQTARVELEFQVELPGLGWHVSSVAATEGLSLVHLRKGEARDLLFAKVGRAPCRPAHEDFPQLALGAKEKILGVTAFCADSASVLVAVHRRQAEEVYKLTT